MASPVGDEQPPSYESLIPEDRHNPSYIDMSGPNYQSIIDTEGYYVMPNPPVTLFSGDTDLIPTPTSVDTSKLDAKSACSANK